MQVKTLEVKKTSSLSTAKSKDDAVTVGSILDFIGDVKGELKKIDWTSPEELRVYTKIVVTSTFSLGLGIYCLDVLVQGLMSGLGVMIRLLG